MSKKRHERAGTSANSIMDTLEPRRLFSAKFIEGGLSGWTGTSRGINQYVGATVGSQSLGTLNPGVERTGRGEVHSSGYRAFTFTLAKPVTTTITLAAASDSVRAMLPGPYGKTIFTMKARQEAMATPLDDRDQECVEA